jgi:uncharacterized protein YbcI
MEPSASSRSAAKSDLDAGMSSNGRQHPAPGFSLPAAISRHVVRLFSEYTGRGPTRARTMISDNVIVCVTHDTLTKGERRLVADGEAETVVSIRRKFQSTMREDLVSGVELLTGRTVLSFMSDHDALHDYAAEIFVLDAAPAEQARSAEPETRLES